MYHKNKQTRCITDDQAGKVETVKWNSAAVAVPTNNAEWLSHKMARRIYYMAVTTSTERIKRAYCQGRIRAVKSILPLILEYLR